MTDDSARSSAFLDQVRRRRDALHEHIRQSEINIANSKEVLRQVDQIIADAEKEEWGFPRCRRHRSHPHVPTVLRRCG
jgi:hypothetical protein